MSIKEREKQNGNEEKNKLLFNSEEQTIFENRIAIEHKSVSLNQLKWLTTSEAASYLRISIGSIKNMVYRGRLAPRKLGRLNRFLREDLDRELNSSFFTKGEI